MINLPFLRKINLKYKLIAAFAVSIIPLMILGSYATYAYLKQTYLEIIQKELKNSSDALTKMIETTAAASIRNYLRAVAEKNLEVIGHYYEDYQAGRIDKAALFTLARKFFDSQTIGRTGYLYCIDSQGLIVLHPNEKVQGSRPLDFTFIKDQIIRKNGYLEYDWQNPGDTGPRPKALYMVYFEPLDWIISASAYREEFKGLIQLSDIHESVSDLRYGDSGFAFMFDGNGGLLVHPRKDQADNIKEVIYDGDSVFRTIAMEKSGQIRFSCRKTGGRGLDPKLAYFEYIDDYAWYVGTCYSEDEIFRPLGTLRTIIVITFALILVMFFAVATWFSAYANNHIQNLIDAFAQGAGGYFKARLKTGARDEFGRLSRYFNTFMEKLESYQRSLLEEIEKRRQMQNAVYESEQRLKKIVQNAPVLLWAIDREGILTFHEGTLPDQLNLCGCMVNGHPLKETWGQWDGVAEHIDRALAGQAGVLHIKDPEYAIEIHYNSLFDIGKEVYGAVGVAIDVTSRWQAEQKLSETEQERQKLVMAVEQSAEIIFITDTSGTIEYVNPGFEKSSGYTRAEAIGMNPSILKSGKHDARFYADLWQTVSNGRIWSGRIVNKKKDGTLFYEDATISPLRNEHGEIVNFVASKRDVTQEVVLEDQLQHSERMKAIGTLAGGIAHDFNNILSGMMGYTELCLIEAPAESALANRLEKIMHAGQRAKDLISHIQTFSRQSSVEPVPMLPAPVISEAVKLIKASFPAITIDRKIQDVGAILAVPTQIHQIVMNLCTNACHAMQQQGGMLTITLSKQHLDAESARQILDISTGHYARLTVTDTGHGIPKEILGKIFDPYFTTKADGEGSGLGLSVVHGIVKSLAGAVKVHSEPGSGTIFNIYFPLLSSGGAQDVQKQTAVARGNQESILLADDEDYV